MREPIETMPEDEAPSTGVFVDHDAVLTAASLADRLRGEAEGTVLVDVIEDTDGIPRTLA